MTTECSRFAIQCWTEPRGCDGTPDCGDFCDCIQLTASRYALISGDLAGHGPGVRDAARRLYAYTVTVASSCMPLSTGMMAIDTFFAQAIRSDTLPFASVFVAHVDLGSGELRYASAGHEHALLFTEDYMHQHLVPTGSILGVDGVTPHAERALRLARESFLVLVSDGITESRRRVHDGFVFFGSSGVAAAVRGALREKRDPAREVYSAALRHGNCELTDDASVLVSRLTLGSPSSTTYNESTVEPKTSVRQLR